jgi:SAM-dependent methyltransferase
MLSLLESHVVIGVDLDRESLLDYHRPASLADLAQLPFHDDTFDLVICEYVVEHLDAPERVFREFYRTLTAGGQLLLLTPNKYSYIVTVSRLLPYRAHLWFGRHRYGKGMAHDMFPTLYRSNSSGELRRGLSRAGFVVERLDLVSNGPAWFEGMPILFALGRLWHRLVEMKWFAPLRCALLVRAIKPP